MEDRELYRRILGVENPWRVASVDLQVAPKEVHVYLAHEDLPTWPCAECGAASKLYDHQPERQWRHLDTCQYRTILHAEPPRSQCPAHGVRVVKLPWAEPSSRFTALFEALAIAWLKAASQKAVGDQLGLSWDKIHGIMERVVKRGLARRQAEPVRHLGVDEKAFRKGHKYMTVVNDLVRGRVLYVAEDRKQESLNGFWGTLTEGQKEGIEAVAMDMWDPYVNSVREHVADAEQKIVFDKFQVAQHLGQAVDEVRRKENKSLRAAGDDRWSRKGLLTADGRSEIGSPEWKTSLDGPPTGASDEMGWPCGADLTGRQMRAPFTIGPKRPTASEHADQRGRAPKVKRGRDRECRAVGAAVPDSRRARCARTSPYARSGPQPPTTWSDDGAP